MKQYYLKTIIQGWSQYCDGEPIDPVVVEPKEYTLIPARIEAENYDTQSGTQSESTNDVDGWKLLPISFLTTVLKLLNKAWKKGEKTNTFMVTVQLVEIKTTISYTIVI